MIFNVGEWVGEWAEICNHTSNCVQLHHQIDQAFTIFLVNVEEHGYEATAAHFSERGNEHFNLCHICIWPTHSIT